MAALSLAQAWLLSCAVTSEPTPGPVELVLALDAGCLDHEDLQQGIADTLGLAAEAEVQSRSRSWIEIRATREKRGFRAAVAVRGEDGREKQRNLEIDHTSCRELRDAVVLVSALLLDELWAEGRTLHPPVPPQDTSAADTPPPAQARLDHVEPAQTQPVSSAPVSPRQRSWTVSSTITGILAVGDLPGPAGGFGLRVGFDAPRVVGFSVVAGAWPHREIRDSTNAGARFSAYEIGASLCPRMLTRKRVELVACLGAAGGVSHVRGVGLAAAQANVRPRALVDTGIAVRVLVAGPVFIGVGAGARIPIVRDRFQYADTAGEAVEIHRAWPVVPMFELALTIRSQLPRHAQKPVE